MKKQTKQVKKEKMVKASEAEAKFNVLKKQSMVTSYHAAMSIQEVLANYREFIEQVLITQPNEQTLLKKLAEEKLEFIEERQMFVDMAKAMTEGYVDEEDENED